MRWTKALEVFVPGDPRTKGSFTAIRSPAGKVFMKQSDKSKGWQTKICEMSLGQVELEAPFEGPVSLKVTFLLPRPKSHFRTGKRAGELKDSAPSHPDKIPDIDKLLRAVMDALTRVLYDDDKRVVHVQTGKNYTPGQVGVYVTGWVYDQAAVFGGTEETA